MAKFISRELPHDVYRRLNGEDLEGCAGKVILISTVDNNGWPHPAMLSYLEVVAKDRHNIRLATYKDSGTTNNMRQNGKLTMSIIDERCVYYVKGRVEELKREMSCAPQVSKLNMVVEQVLADHADQRLEADRYVAGGVTYKDPNLNVELAKAREVLSELLRD